MIPLNTADTSLIRVTLIIYDAFGELDDTADVDVASELQTSINGAAWADADGTLVLTGDGAYYYQGVVGDATTAGKLKVKFKKTGYITSISEEDVAEVVTGLEIRSGTAQAGGASTITLDAGASATNNLYTDGIVTITGGTGVGQVNTITAYAGATKIATVSRAWAIVPDATSEFVISPAPASANPTAVAAAVGARVVEGAHTNDDLMRGLVGAIAGTTTDYTTGTIVAKSLNGAKTRFTWTVDETGRLTVTSGDLT